MCQVSKCQVHSLSHLRTYMYSCFGFTKFPFKFAFRLTLPPTFDSIQSYFIRGKDPMLKQCGTKFSFKHITNTQHFTFLVLVIMREELTVIVGT